MAGRWASSKFLSGRRTRQRDSRQAGAAVLDLILCLCPLSGREIIGCRVPHVHESFLIFGKRPVPVDRSISPVCGVLECVSARKHTHLDVVYMLHFCASILHTSRRCSPPLERRGFGFHTPTLLQRNLNPRLS